MTRNITAEKYSLALYAKAVLDATEIGDYFLAYDGDVLVIWVDADDVARAQSHLPIIAKRAVDYHGFGVEVDIAPAKLSDY